jgi:feruloyl esterase
MNMICNRRESTLMTQRLLVLPMIVAAWLAIPAAAREKSPDAFAKDAALCMAMQGRTIGPGQVVAATFERPPYVTDSPPFRSQPITVAVPFCRLEGAATPSVRSYVRFEVWLPAVSHWNGRLLGVGTGNMQGSINNGLLAIGVNRGFAAVATDNGHRSPGAVDGSQWALHEPERIVDFGFRAQHVATEAAKAAVRAVYDRQQSYSYFYGCSQGGQKAMMEAERFASDYDGIAAGAPVFSWTAEMMFQAWGVRAFTETPESSISVPQMQALYESVVKRCAAENGLVMDPRHCDFDPASLQCPRSDGSVCLTPEQVIAVKKVYDGPRTSDGTRITSGMMRGSERDWEQFYGKVSADGSHGGGSFLGFLRNMVFEDPAWTLQDLNFDRDWPLARQKVGNAVDADNLTLEAFAERGGKLIVYQGWADQQVPPEAAIAFRDALVKKTAPAQVDGYMRLFMVPGMLHCSLPGPGPNLVFQENDSAETPVQPERDVLGALQMWVEQGQAPEHFVVRLEDERRRITSSTVLSCREPQSAHYRGSGDAKDAANWQCVK